MNKRQLIEEIRRYNTTASEKFLEQFDEDSLKQYLEHLEAASRNQKEICSWVRKGHKTRVAV